MLREERTAKNKADVGKLVGKYRLMESWANPYSAKGVWGCEYRVVWGDFYSKFHAFAWKFDEKGNVKSYMRVSKTRICGLEFFPDE